MPDKIRKLCLSVFQRGKYLILLDDFEKNLKKMQIPGKLPSKKMQTSLELPSEVDFLRELLSKMQTSVELSSEMHTTVKLPSTTQTSVGLPSTTQISVELSSKKMNSVQPRSKNTLFRTIF